MQSERQELHGNLANKVAVKGSEIGNPEAKKTEYSSSGSSGCSPIPSACLMNRRARSSRLGFRRAVSFDVDERG